MDTLHGIVEKGSSPQVFVFANACYCASRFDHEIETVNLRVMEPEDYGSLTRSASGLCFKPKGIIAPQFECSSKHPFLVANQGLFEPEKGQKLNQAKMLFFWGVIFNALRQSFEFQGKDLLGSNTIFELMDVNPALKNTYTRLLEASLQFDWTLEEWRRQLDAMCISTLTMLQVKTAVESRKEIDFGRILRIISAPAERIDLHIVRVKWKRRRVKKER